MGNLSRRFWREEGQSLAEIIVALGLVTIIISSAVTAVVVGVQANLKSINARAASSLGEEMMNEVRSTAEGSWTSLYNVSPKGASSTFRIVESGSPPTFSVASGTEAVVVNGVTYTRSFAVENVNRYSSSTIAVSGGTEDPSTQKVTVTVNWPVAGGTGEVKTTEYLSRFRNEVTKFTDWSGSSGIAGPITTPDANYYSESNLDGTSTVGSLALASGQTSGSLISSTFSWPADATSSSSSVAGMSATNHWAWSDVIGWIDFYNSDTVKVTNSKMQYYASSTTGSIGLDCATTPSGDQCATSNFFVSNDGSGNLAGWAWNDTIGWISFCGDSSGNGSTYNGSTWVCPASPTYQVTVNPSTGDFTGWAWNDTIGWISFNCNNSGIGDTCATSSYKVVTDWRSGGAGSNGTVKFQLATSACSNGATDYPDCITNTGWGGAKTSGDGAFLGPDGTSATYYTTNGSGQPAAVYTIYHNNKLFFRYKIYLDQASAQNIPVVNDVIINWSP